MEGFGMRIKRDAGISDAELSNFEEQLKGAQMILATKGKYRRSGTSMFGSGRGNGAHGLSL